MIIIWYDKSQFELFRSTVHGNLPQTRAATKTDVTETRVEFKLGLFPQLTRQEPRKYGYTKIRILHLREWAYRTKSQPESRQINLILQPCKFIRS